MTSVIGTAGGQFINVLAIPVLARVYLPADFGTWSLYLAAVAVMSVIATLRFDLAVVAARATKTAECVLVLTVAFAALIGATLEVLLLAVLLLGNDGGSDLLLRNLPWLVWTPLGISMTALYTAFISWWLRNGAYSRITFVRIGLPASSVALQIFLRDLPHGIGLVAGNCLAQSIAALVTGAFVVREIRNSFLDRRLPARAYVLARRFGGFALYTTPYSLQGQFFRQIILVILASFVSTAASGLYVMAQRAVYNPLALIAAALDQATFPRLARTPSDPRVHRLIARAMFWLALLLSVGCAFVTVFATSLVPLVLGSKWSASVPYIVAISYASASLVASSWIARIFDVFGRQKLHLVVDLTANLVVLAGFVATLLLTQSALWGVIALSAGLTVYYWFRIALSFRIAGMDTGPLPRMLAASIALWATSYLLFSFVHRVFA